MPAYRLMDGADGRPGNGPSTAVSYTGNFLAGTAFKVTADNLWFEGYWWWVCDSGQQTDPQSFALWQVDNTNDGLLVEGSTVTSGTLTGGTWNYIALPTSIPLSRSIPYVVATGYVSTSGFPNTNDQFGAGDPYSAGIVNGPVKGSLQSHIRTLPYIYPTMASILVASGSTFRSRPPRHPALHTGCGRASPIRQAG